MLQQRNPLQSTDQAQLQPEYYDSHANRKLTPHEIQLIEYSFFSLSEEVDLFYCE